MNVNRSIRLTHRWVSPLFVLAVIASSVAAATGEAQDSPLFVLPLLPLALLTLTGTWLFVVTVFGRRRGSGPALADPVSTSAPRSESASATS